MVIGPSKNQFYFNLIVRWLNRHPECSKGFTLVEVLVAVLILTTFLTLGMTAVVTACLVKTRAASTTIATNWIEEDLEAVKAQATQLSYVASRCNPTGTNPSAAGFASLLQQNLPTIARNGTQTVAGKTYTMTRQVAVSATAPYEVLQIDYAVQVNQPTATLSSSSSSTTASSSTTSTNANTTVATLYTEVIPNAAFQCSRFQ